MMGFEYIYEDCGQFAFVAGVVHEDAMVSDTGAAGIREVEC